MKLINIEEYIKDFLQSDIIIYNDKKVFKRGKLILFNQKEFYYVLQLQDEKNNIKEYLLPYPFDIDRKKDYVIFDYNIDKFINENSIMYYKSKVLNFDKKNKFYNTTVVLSAI